MTPDRSPEMLLALVSPLCAEAGLGPPLRLERLPGGGNNRVYRVETGHGRALLKEYFRHEDDPRDRLAAERAFAGFAWEQGIRALPRPLAYDPLAGLGLCEFVDGRRLLSGEVTAAHVGEAAAFLAAVNRNRGERGAATLPTASEACFSTADHLACVDRRLNRLGTIEPESAAHRQAAGLVSGRLQPLWERVHRQVVAAVAANALLDDRLPAAGRILSPSDFGFHNCIATSAGLRFIDFEYAGWDDPAKTVCDFFCQPAVPVPREYGPAFLEAVAGWADTVGNIRGRVALLLPVYELKWCCIMLNEFLPVGDTRRAFARADERLETLRAEQLQKVEASLARLEA